MGQHMPNRMITFTLMLKFQADDCWGEAPECQRGKERVIGSSGFRSFPQILCWYRKGMSLSAHESERRQEKCGATATLFSVTWWSDGIGRGSGVDKDVGGVLGLVWLQTSELVCGWQMKARWPFNPTEPNRAGISIRAERSATGSAKVVWQIGGKGFWHTCLESDFKKCSLLLCGHYIWFI